MYSSIHCWVAQSPNHMCAISGSTVRDRTSAVEASGEVGSAGVGRKRTA
jgi:hypothetical protein